MEYEWIVYGALGNIIAQGKEPAWCIAEKQAAKHAGDREDVTSVVKKVEENEISTA